MKEKQYCPICKKEFITSPYLNNIFNNGNSRWLANMVMHYRHSHTAWDKTWSRGYYYRQQSWGNHKGYDYDKAKRIANERAKRQILRKCKDHMINMDFTVSDVEKLQGTEAKTIELYSKLLNAS